MVKCRLQNYKNLRYLGTYGIKKNIHNKSFFFDIEQNLVDYHRPSKVILDIIVYI